MDFVCETCGMKFLEAHRLKRHIKSIHEDGGETIEHIRQRNKNNVSIEHLQTLKEIQCDICSNTFLDQEALTVHKSISHGILDSKEKRKMKMEAKRQTCDKCGKTFSAKHSMTDHFKTEHPTPEQIAAIQCICQACGADEFVDAGDFNMHLSKCLKDPKDFTCDKCSTPGWRSTLALQKHIVESHGVILVICEIGGCSLRSKHSLPSHKRRIHDGIKEFPCSYCPELFKSQQVLTSHVGTVHASEAKKFKCDKCEFSTTYVKSLKVHYQSKHDKSETFECHLCNYVGYRKDVVKKHVKIVHEKWRPYPCPYCDKAYITGREQRKHILVHHPRNI